MNPNRRHFLHTTAQRALLLSLLAAGLARAAGGRLAFEAYPLAQGLRALDAAQAAPHRDIQLKAPDIAENAASVSIDVASVLPETESISLVVDKNPHPLAARFRFLPGARPQVQLRLKMAQSSSIRAVVRAGGKTWQVARDVKVTLGGCSA